MISQAVETARDENLKRVVWMTLLGKLVMSTLILTYVLTQTPFEALGMAIAYTVMMGVALVLLGYFWYNLEITSTKWERKTGFQYYVIMLVLDFIVFVSWYFVFLGGRHNAFRKHPDNNKIPHADDPSFYTYQALNVVFVVTSVGFVLMAATFINGSTDLGLLVFYAPTQAQNRPALWVTVVCGAAAFGVMILSGLFTYFDILGFDTAPLWVYLMFYVLGAALTAAAVMAYFFIRADIPAAGSSKKSTTLPTNGHWQTLNVCLVCLATWVGINLAFWIRAGSSHHGDTHGLRHKVQFDPTLAIQPYFLYTYMDIQTINAALSAFAVYYLITIICVGKMGNTANAFTEIGRDETMMVAGKTMGYKWEWFQRISMGVYATSFVYELLVAGFTLAELQEKFFLSKHFHEWIICYVAISGAFNFAMFILACMRLFSGGGQGEPHRCATLRTTVTSIYIYVTVGYAYFWIHSRFDDPDYTRASLTAMNAKNPIIWWDTQVYVLLVTLMKIIMFVDQWRILAFASVPGDLHVL